MPQRLNRVTVSSGRPLDADRRPRADGSLEALVSEGFAQAHGLKPGRTRRPRWSTASAARCVIAGTALSPEFIFAGLWGMPDLRGFGVFWIDRDALAAAYDMEGAFNRVAVKLAPGASRAGRDRRPSRGCSRRYGGRDAHGRDEQTSHAMLDNEIKEQRVLGTVLPAIFLGGRRASCSTWSWRGWSRRSASRSPR